MKTLIKILYAISFLALITSCGMFKTYVASYSVGLKTVESPANAKQQFGDTKVVNFQEGTTNKYRYEDDYINIVWYVDSKQFNFNLTNKSGHTLKINWDDISYVDYNGKNEIIVNRHLLFQKGQALPTSFYQPKTFITSRDNMAVGESIILYLLFTKTKQQEPPKHPNTLERL